MIQVLFYKLKKIININKNVKKTITRNNVQLIYFSLFNLCKLYSDFFFISVSHYNFLVYS